MIVNADDFGISTAVNKAVLDAFEERLISSATVMAVMPGFEEACALAVESGLQRHVGLHFVLSEGAPLTEPIRSCKRFCNPAGSFRTYRESGRLVYLSAVERDAVAHELHAQLEACRTRGLPVTHLDSHKHIHTEAGLWPLVLFLARKFDVPFVRPARAARQDLGLSARLNRASFDWALRRARLAATRYFGGIDDYRRMRADGVDKGALLDFELMTHPEHDATGKLVDYTLFNPGLALKDLVGEVAGAGEAVSFAGARYEPTR